ncbi:hypothetical protein EHP00_2364 [Ecytonucleospora hepatopenaei]|uniref:Uncharacterized protein n=1 Tax=Ecytonucleospora hepatopenaei TaxID=646526 RepID=A0A1W0E7R8_9MICR|nr:hypothetical protein EHP00_2364 [Ecytonucleospora hepatopenaei]
MFILNMVFIYKIKSSLKKDDNSAPLKFSGSFRDKGHTYSSESESLSKDVCNEEEDVQDIQTGVNKQKIYSDEDSFDLLVDELADELDKKWNFTHNEKSYEIKSAVEYSQIVANVYKKIVGKKQLISKHENKIKNSIWSLIALFKKYTMYDHIILSNDNLTKKLKDLKTKIRSLQNIIKYNEENERIADFSKRALYNTMLDIKKKMLKDTEEEFKKLKAEKDKRYREHKYFTDRICHILSILGIFIKHKKILAFIKDEF